MIHVGTSGWQYDDWRGRFYPREMPTRQWLAHYSSRFSTVEVNASFYRLPDPSTFERWKDETPESFVMAVKASRYITHVRRLRDCGEPLERLLLTARELGPKLGPVLFQLPPTFRVDPELLAGFVRLIPPAVRAAFEFREPSWMRDDVVGVLDAAGAALVLADRPAARVPSLVTGGWSYLRFHQGGSRTSGYRREKLARWADRIGALPAADVFAYFNNDAGGAAVRDADTMIELLRARGLAVAG